MIWPQNNINSSVYSDDNDKFDNITKFLSFDSINVTDYVKILCINLNILHRLVLVQ